MRIALDATPLTVTTGGVKRYTAELARALAETFPEDRIYLVSDQQFDNPAPELPNIHSGRGPRNVMERRWWLWGLQGELSRLNIEVFHGTDFSVPYLPARPSVMTLHDLSPWLDPNWHSAADRIRKRTPVLLRLGLVTMIIVPSEAVRRQAIERFRLRPDRVVAIPLAVPDYFRPAESNKPTGLYFLYVGTLEPRKNVELLIESWRGVRQRHAVDLKLVGRRREDFPEVAPEPGLEILGPIPDEELPVLYSGALACVYPSHYEGFGLPVLEAMQCGAAVIASRDEAISETAGGAAILLDAGDRRAWTEALSAAVTERDRMGELRSKGLMRAAEFSWKRTATLTREVYSEAALRFRKKRLKKDPTVF
jgi:glycosyltransferase involved in cell wall biosynthesis